MLWLFQKPLSNLSAAIKTALSETWPPRRNLSQNYLDLGLNEKPLGTSFGMIWFRQGKNSAKHSAAWAPQETGQGELGSVQLCGWHSPGRAFTWVLTASSEDLNEPQNDKARRAATSRAMENCSERWMLSILQPGDPPAPRQGIGQESPSPAPQLSIFICGTNLAQKHSKLNSEMLCIYQDHGSN